jgi:chromosome segregation protein
MRRLGRTEDNMVRVGDLVAELEPQLRHLERQAKSAREYNQVEAELHAALDAWYGRLWQQAGAEFDTAEREEQAALAGRDRAQAAVAVAETALLDARQAGHRLQAELDALLVEGSALQREQDAADRALAVHSERRAALERQRAALAAEVEAGAGVVGQAAAQLAALAAEQTQATGHEAALRTRVREAELALQASVEARRAADHALTAAQEGAAADSARMVGLRQRLAGSADHQQELARQAQEQADALTRLEARQAEEQGTLAAAQGRVGAAEADLTAAQAAAQEAEQGYLAAAAARDRAEATRKAATAALDRTRARLDVLTSLHEGHTGLPHAVRTVLGAAGAAGAPRRKGAGEVALSGIVGVVAGLIQVPEELETAIEVALGGRLYDVVVERWADAEAAIRFLQGGGAGRATFLPLDSLRQGRDPGDVLRDLGKRAGVRGLAAELVDTSSEYRVVVEQLLGRTLVVDDLKTARSVLGRVPMGWNVVTVGGEIVRANGAVTGGSAAREQGLLARERERRDLQAALDGAERDLTAAGVTLQEAAAGVQRAEVARQEAADRVAAARRALAERRGTVQQLELRLANSAQEHTWRTGLRDQAVAAQQDFGSRLADFAADLARMEAATEPTALLVAALQTAAQDARTAEAAAREEGTAARTNLAVAEEGARHRRTALQTAQAAHARVANQQAARTAALQTAEAEFARAAAAAQDAAAAAAAAQEAAAAHAGRLAPVRQALGERQAVLATREHALDEAQKHLLASDTAAARATVERERRQEALDSLRARIEADLPFTPADAVLTEVLALASGATRPLRPGDPEPLTWESWTARIADYGVRIADYPAQNGSSGNGHAHSDDLTDAQSKIQNPKSEILETRVAQLRGRLRRMGPVNPLAIEEFAAAQERHTFLSTQLADLEGAAAGLRQVAADLDRIMRERLATTFQAVAVAFAEMFPRLFGGGSARLDLTDPADVTATGVEIIAQPPGKRPQTLAALSGGERALTAVALLFALLTVRPAPFCVLDEVDAALDEANIGRFRDQLAALAARTQFVLVTHNRATIEAAGAIYGVSLGSDSVSQLLSLRLDQVGVRG